MLFWAACMMATPPVATGVSPSLQRGRRTTTSHHRCGMQTPGTLILDGGEFDRGPDRATSRAITTHLPGGITPQEAKLALIVAGGARLEDEERDDYLALWTTISSTGLGFDLDGFTILHPEQENPRHSGVEDAAEADSDDFVKPLETADVVFMRGGRQWRLVDAFKYTKTHEEMWNLLERGGTIAGTSAGSTSQGFFMPRGDPDGASRLVADREWHQYGFGFLSGVAVDVHVDGRDRWDDLYEVLREEDPTLLGIGISEYTAIVVQGHYFHVVGDDVLTNLVAVYNCSDKTDCNAVDSPYLTLKPGDWYDLCSREVVSAPPPETAVLQSARSFALPYFFEDDYRLAAREYQCSGRHCRWLSSQIDTGGFTRLGLSAYLTSRGDLEAVDFLKVSYRLRVDSIYGDWIDLYSVTAGVDVEISADIFVDPDVPETTLQIRIESATSVEGGETYMVQMLGVSGETLGPGTTGNSLQQGSGGKRLALTLGVIGITVALLIAALVLSKRRKKKTPSPTCEKPKSFGLEANLSALSVVRVETHPSDGDSSVWASDESVHSKNADRTTSIVQQEARCGGNSYSRDQRTLSNSPSLSLERHTGSLLGAVDMDAPDDETAQDVGFLEARVAP